MQPTASPPGEMVEFTLGHRLRGRDYQVQPVAVARPPRGSVQFVVPCLTCGQPVTITVPSRGAGSFFRALFWRWNIGLGVVMLALFGLCPLSLAAAFAIAWLTDPSTDPTAIFVAGGFAVLMLGLLALPVSVVAGMRNSPRIVDTADREATAFVIGNFGLDQQHHLLTKDASRRLPSERLRGRAGYFTPMGVTSARPAPSPMPVYMPQPGFAPQPGMPFAAAPGVPVMPAAPMAPGVQQADPAAMGASLGRTHAAEAQRTGVVLSGQALTAYAQQLAQAAAASLRIGDPAFLASYAEAYVAAYTAGAPAGR